MIKKDKTGIDGNRTSGRGAADAHEGLPRCNMLHLIFNDSPGLSTNTDSSITEIPKSFW